MFALRPATALGRVSPPLRAGGGLASASRFRFGVLNRARPRMTAPARRALSSAATPSTLIPRIGTILRTADLQQKCALVRALCDDWSGGRVALDRFPGDTTAHHPERAARLARELPHEPHRPPEPVLLDALLQMPAPRATGVTPTVYALHNVAHIELNALELYLDTTARFAGTPRGFVNAERAASDVASDEPPTGDGPFGHAFVSDLLSIVADETRHFELCRARLVELGSRYGALPAHRELWANSIPTRHDLGARLALVALVQEARGLDAGDRFVERMRAAHDARSAELVDVIARDELRHVRSGVHWYTTQCVESGDPVRAADPGAFFQSVVRQYAPRSVCPPFNEIARTAAGLPAGWYLPVAKRRPPFPNAATPATTTPPPDAPASDSPTASTAAPTAPAKPKRGPKQKLRLHAVTTAAVFPPSAAGGAGTRAYSTHSCARASSTPQPSAGASAAAAHVVFITLAWPEVRSSAAGVHTYQLMDVLQTAGGYRLTCLSNYRDTPYRDALHARGIATQPCAPNDPAFDGQIAALAPDVVVFDTLKMEEMFGWRVRRAAPRAVRVLDTQDLHFLRLTRQRMVLTDARPVGSALLMEPPFWAEPPLPGAGVAPDPAASSTPGADDESVDHMYRELAAIHRTDLTLLVSNVERDLLVRRFAIAPDKLALAPFFYRLHNDDDATTAAAAAPAAAAPSPPAVPAFAERQHFVTIGHWGHRPNGDGVRWLKTAIWPRIRARLPDAEMHVFGAYARPQDLALDSGSADGFHVRGALRDVADLARYRVLLAPLRFGAGVKGKVVDAWNAACPVVTTRIGSEGLCHDTCRNVCGCATGAAAAPAPCTFGGAVADDPAAFAAQAVALYSDATAWHAAQRHAQELLRSRFSFAANAAPVLAAFARVRAEALAWRQSDLVAGLVWHRGATTEWMSRYIETKKQVRELKLQLALATAQQPQPPPSTPSPPSPSPSSPTPMPPTSSSS